MDPLTIVSLDDHYQRALAALEEATRREVTLPGITLHWNDECGTEFHELLRVADEARVSVAVRFDVLRPSLLSDIVFRYRYPRPESHTATQLGVDDGLEIGKVLPMPPEPVDYDNARGMSLISRPMQNFIQELRDALWTMRAGKREPVRMPWDPLDRQSSRTRRSRDGALTLSQEGHPNISEVFQTYQATNFHDILGYDDRSVPPTRARAGGWGRNVKLLVTGNSGTGKSLVAHLAHQVLYPDDHTARHFSHLNCSALDTQNAEFDLFGAGPGTYTGVDYRVGELARAAYGTAFFDEFGDLPSGTAPVLLTYLDNLMVRPRGMLPFFGFTHIIAATNRDLNARIRAGEFRNDLVQRFARVITIPSLKTRGPAEILTLVDMAAQNPYENPMESFRGKDSRPVTRVSSSALTQLSEHDYHDGNVRELESIVHSGIQRSRRRNSTTLDSKDLVLPKKSSYIPDAERHIVPVMALPNVKYIVELEHAQDLDRIADRTARPILKAPDDNSAVIVDHTCYRYIPESSLLQQHSDDVQPNNV